MSKVLVIRKTDKTIHKVALANKAALMEFNNKQPEGKKWTFEEMEEAEADKLPFIDESYVTAGEAQEKAKELEKTVGEKDARIAELEAKLASLNNPLTAEQLIEQINLATTEEQVNAFLINETRKTVIAAAEKKIASFSKS